MRNVSKVPKILFSPFSEKVLALHRLDEVPSFLSWQLLLALIVVWLLAMLSVVRGFTSLAKVPLKKSIQYIYSNIISQICTVMLPLMLAFGITLLIRALIDAPVNREAIWLFFKPQWERMLWLEVNYNKQYNTQRELLVLAQWRALYTARLVHRLEQCALHRQSQRQTTRSALQRHRRADYLASIRLSVRSDCCATAWALARWTVAH